jgi:hypothetical protein
MTSLKKPKLVIESDSDEDEEKKEKEKENVKTFSLQLSDIIHIESPKNKIIDGQTFIIDYIDQSIIKLINVDDLISYKIKINSDGTLEDNTIISITLINRDSNLGYARQNNLLPDTWVDVYFGGDMPVIITGMITNLEEDMIEIKTYPDNDILYINFGYKGIPLDLPIETIQLREEPGKNKLTEEGVEEKGEKEEKEESIQSIDSIDSTQSSIQDLKQEYADIAYGLPVKDAIREFIVRADEIQIGEKLGSVAQLVNVEEEQFRYNINSQTEDLLNELLSSIPNSQRTSSVLNNIHTIIERYKQLRVEFSDLDEHGNVLGAVVKSVTWKPLVKNLLQFKTLLYWLIPVVKNVKKVYNISQIEDTDRIPDIMPLNIDTDVEDMNNVVLRYKSNDVPSEQNKYFSLLSEMDPFLTPFTYTDPELQFDIIDNIRIQTDLNVIIDNLGEFYSSIAKNDIIKTRKFVINRYNLGVNRLEASQFTGSKMIAHQVTIVPADTLELKSLLTLPEPAIRFSRVNLPGSNILEKANLNTTFINYWELLNEDTPIKNIIVDDLDKEIEFSEKKFVNNIKNYTLALRDEHTGETKRSIYKKFLRAIIPRTRVLFNLMQKYIHGKLSIYDIVQYLEPFLVYTSDLTFMQYKEIDKFLKFKISDYNKNFKEREKAFSVLKKQKGEQLNSTKIISLITDRSINNEIFRAYSFNDINMSNSELLYKMITTDFSNIYNNALALINIGTLLPENIGSIIENIDSQKSELEEEIRKDEAQNKCMNIIIAKQYTTLEEVAADNDKITYFDKKFDDTHYSILDEYQKEQISLEPDKFNEFLIQKLVNKHKYSVEDAPYIAETLITGVKRVVEADFAMLYNAQEDKMVYFKRAHNKWKPDTTIDDKIITSNKSMLCSFQKDCIEVDKKYKSICETQDLNKKHITENILKEIVNQFDKKYEMSSDTLRTFLSDKLKHSISILEKIVQIKNTSIFKYNTQQYKIGIRNEIGEQDEIMSPYIRLRDLILGQSNMAKRETDILQFTVRFARDPNPEEDIYWKYCIKTNTKLLPSFIYILASCWEEDPENYMKTMDIIIKDCGALSDDGDSWVDKHSGYTIRKIDFDIDEGYEEGYKVNTRSVLQQDLGDALIASSLKKAAPKYTTKETKMMSNIISALSENMGINLDDQMAFMIKIISDNLLGGALISEADYKIHVDTESKKGKKMPDYVFVFNNTILYLTLGAFLIGIQTSIPSVKTRKTYPGCNRSFAGYPFEGAGDLSSLQYLACVAYKIRSSVDPWSALTKIKETTIAEKIKIFIDRYYIDNAEVMQKFRDKLEFLLVNVNEAIPQEHELSDWTQFLPPLVPIKIKASNLLNISEEFKSQCLRDLREGATCQRDKILIIKSKIIFFALAIQEKIQNIVKKKQLLLENSAKEPFLENACCTTDNKVATIDYFNDIDHEILEYNTIVSNLSNIIDDINAVAKSPFFFCNENTKNIYAPLSDVYNDETIYTAFIVFCKFNSIIPISPELQAICGDKPEYFSTNDSLIEKIKKLKQDGKNYNNGSLLHLLQFIARKNIVRGGDLHLVSQIQKIRNILEADKEIDIENKFIPDELNTCFEGVLDTFDIVVQEDSKEMVTLKNYLAEKNEELKSEVNDFIVTNTKLKKSASAKIKIFLNTFLEWGSTDKDSISDTATYNSINFVKNYIQNFLKVFPNIILNGQNYTHNQIPDYLGLSYRHVKDIQSIIAKYYLQLKPFYENGILFNILTKIIRISDNLLQLSTNTFYTTEIDETKHSIFDKTTCLLLFENYFLQILKKYMDLTDDLEMLSGSEDAEIPLLEKTSSIILNGNKKGLRTKTAELIIGFLTIMMDHKKIADLSYTEIMESVFKNKEDEKNTFTDRLQALTVEERNIDTVLKINKLGAWSKGLQKGLTTYVKETYDEERGQEAEEEIEGVHNTSKKDEFDSDVEDEDEDESPEHYYGNDDDAGSEKDPDEWADED